LVEGLQAEIDSVAWYHEFDFGNGHTARSRTPDVAAHRRLWNFIEEGLSRIDFRGKTVLDIGCWDGYWSFYAERHGAASVLATDDLSQNWSTGEEHPSCQAHPQLRRRGEAAHRSAIAVRRGASSSWKARS